MAITYMTPNALFLESQNDVDELGVNTQIMIGYFNSALTEIYDVTEGFLDFPDIQDDQLEADYTWLSAKGIRGIIKEYINYSIKLTEEDVNLARERQITASKILIKVRNMIMNTTFDASGIKIGNSGFDITTVNPETTYFNIHPDCIKLHMIDSSVAILDTEDMTYPNDLLSRPLNSGGAITNPLDVSNIFIKGNN